MIDKVHLKFISVLNVFRCLYSSTNLSNEEFINSTDNLLSGEIIIGWLNCKQRNLHLGLLGMLRYWILKTAPACQEKGDFWVISFV